VGGECASLSVGGRYQCPSAIELQCGAGVRLYPLGVRCRLRQRRMRLQRCGKNALPPYLYYDLLLWVWQALGGNIINRGWGMCAFATFMYSAIHIAISAQAVELLVLRDGCIPARTGAAPIIVGAWVFFARKKPRATVRVGMGQRMSRCVQGKCSDFSAFPIFSCTSSGSSAGVGSLRSCALLFMI
jgi:hypothetical protein